MKDGENMPSININEYDYTTHGPSNSSENIVAIPINASDGPADRWITVRSYEEFIQLFGSNPNANSPFGNSWEYAANLLLRGMPICVRRITHELNNDGTNSSTLLKDVKIAKALIKVPNLAYSTDNDNNEFTEEIIYLDDMKHVTTLNGSQEGKEVEEPLYIQAKYFIDGELNTNNEFPTVHSLQRIYKYNDDTEIAIGSFADVTATGTEWYYSGPYTNDYFMNAKLDKDKLDENGNVKNEYIFSMNQLVNDKNNAEFEIGDFFINESRHIVKFTPEPKLNPYYIREQYAYPSDLINYDVSKLEKDKHFLVITHDVDNKTIKNHVWLYSPDNSTTVNNVKFVNGKVSIDEVTEYKAFNKDSDLPKTGQVFDGSFAVIKGDDRIWTYTLQNKSWDPTSDTVDQLVNETSKYSIKVKIPFKPTNVTLNTPNTLYKDYVHWINTGEYEHIDALHPELVYLPTLYWKDSKRAIGTTARTKITNMKTIINDIEIVTSATATSSKISIKVDGESGGVIEDRDNTKLTNGTFGITNDSEKPIRIYSFSVIQRNDMNETVTLYDSALETLAKVTNQITEDSLLQFYDNNTSTYLSNPVPKLDNSGVTSSLYIELAPGCSIYYNKPLKSAIYKFKIVGYETEEYTKSPYFNFVCNTFNSTVGSYNIAFSSKRNASAEVIKNYISNEVVSEEVDYNNIPKLDGNHNFNLFVAEYLYPGYNGNHLSVRIQTIDLQGIYALVYRDNQFLEKIELASFRFRTNSGKIVIYDKNLDGDHIWKYLLNKFGVHILEDGYAYDDDCKLITNYSALPYIRGNYIKLSLNVNAIINREDVISLDYLHGLYTQNGSDVYKLTGGCNPADEHVGHEIYKCYEPLKDKYKYDIKFLTNGTYIDKITFPKTSIYVGTNESDIRLIEDSLIDVAESRKDCVTFLDVPYDLPLEDVPYYFAHISSSYAAAYDPWCQIVLATGGAKWMPPSFVQLYAHAKSMQNGNKLYLPPAGVKRALIPEIVNTNHELSHKYLTAWQDNTTPQFINPIIWINGFDYTIFGQKTLFNIVNESDRYASALQDLNVRLVANEIKKLIFKTCIELTFELNNILTWNEFKSKIEPMLSIMQGEGVLTDYNIVMGTETMTVADLNSGHIVGTVRVSIARAVTDWDINFELTPNGATFTEYDYNSTYSN